jgi:hypothetical protein
MIPGTAKTPLKVHDIQRLRAALGDEAEGILLLHAMTGCDTTSALHGRGKTEPLRKFKGSKKLQEIAKAFYLPNASHSDIAAAGERAIPDRVLQEEDQAEEDVDDPDAIM